MNRALVITALWIATFGTLAIAVFIANGFTAMVALLATLATRWMYRREVMTPEREAYLAKCSKREWFLRRQMESYKRSLKFVKGYLGTEIVAFDNLLSKKELVRARIRELKYKITIYRHELNRLKGKERNTFADGFVCGYNEALRKVSETRRINHSQESWW